MSKNKITGEVMHHLFKLTFITLFVLFGNATLAAPHDDQINTILTAKQAPEGIVFEIVSGDPEGLRTTLPAAKQAIEKLRKKFPNLDIAIVTHGREQFALQKKHKARFKKVHSLTESLVKDSGVNLHVCGTYAEWHNVTEEEFAEYADVAAAGPAQINDYVALGYIKILIEDDE
jgi:intracellular sulfur oxidation DsrE/DsrF family protein